MKISSATRYALQRIGETLLPGGQAAAHEPDTFERQVPSAWQLSAGVAIAAAPVVWSLLATRSLMASSSAPVLQIWPMDDVTRADVEDEIRALAPSATSVFVPDNGRRAGRVEVEFDHPLSSGDAQALFAGICELLALGYVFDTFVTTPDGEQRLRYDDWRSVARMLDVPMAGLTPDPLLVLRLMDAMDSGHATHSPTPGASPQLASAPGTATVRMGASSAPPPPGSHLAPGSILGPYFVLKHVADGRTTSVYAAFDMAAERIVALKQCRSPDADDIRRFQAGFELAERMQEPGMQIFDLSWKSGAGAASSQPFAATTLLQVGHRLDAQRPADLNEAVSLMCSLCEEVGRWHRGAVLVRDLRPENLWVSGRMPAAGDPWSGLSPKVTLFDYDLLSAMAPNGGTVRQDGTLGTPCTASPEQLAGHPIDKRADLFSLGAIFFHLLENKWPFGETEQEVALAQRKGTLPRLKRSFIADARNNGYTATNLRQSCVRILKRALAMDPEDRYQNAKQMRDDLLALRGKIPG